MKGEKGEQDPSPLLEREWRAVRVSGKIEFVTRQPGPRLRNAEFFKIYGSLDR